MSKIQVFIWHDSCRTSSVCLQCNNWFNILMVFTLQAHFLAHTVLIKQLMTQSVHHHFSTELCSHVFCSVCANESWNCAVLTPLRLFYSLLSFHAFFFLSYFFLCHFSCLTYLIRVHTETGSGFFSFLPFICVCFVICSLYILRMLSVTSAWPPSVPVFVARVCAVVQGSPAHSPRVWVCLWKSPLWSGPTWLSSVFSIQILQSLSFLLFNHALSYKALALKQHRWLGGRGLFHQWDSEIWSGKSSVCLQNLSVTKTEHRIVQLWKIVQLVFIYVSNL